MGPPRPDRLAHQPVVPQQGLITLGEGGPVRPRRHRGCQPVGAMTLRHAAQREQGILQPLAEALVALGEAHRAGLPVRVRQHEVVDQVLQRPARDGHPQVGAVREVAGTQPPGVVHLGKEHLLGRSVQGPPLLDTPLQRAELAVREAAGVATSKRGEQRLGLQSGLALQQFGQFGPHLGERVGSGPPVAIHASDLAGQPAEPAVLAGGLGVEPCLGCCPLLG